MSSIVISGDTSGAITLSAPAVAGTNTATLPAATGTVMVSGNMPAFSAYSSANQVISSATATKVTLDTEEFDTNSNFASSRFTPTVAGYYYISGEFFVNSPSNIGYTQARLYKNTSTLVKIGNYYSGPNISEYSNNCNAVIYMNGTTDYIELFAFVGSGTTITLIGGATFYTYMSGALVRAA